MTTWRSFLGARGDTSTFRFIQTHSDWSCRAQKKHVIAKIVCEFIEAVFKGKFNKVDVLCIAAYLPFDGNIQTLIVRVTAHWVFPRTHQHFKISRRTGSKLRAVSFGFVFIRNKNS